MIYKAKTVTYIGTAVVMMAGGVLLVQSAWAMPELEKATPHVLKGATAHDVRAEFYNHKMPQFARLAGVLGWQVGDAGSGDVVVWNGFPRVGYCDLVGNWWLQADGSAMCSTGGLPHGRGEVLSKQRLELGTMQGTSMSLGEPLSADRLNDVAYEAWLVNAASSAQSVWVRLDKSRTLSVANQEVTRLGAVVSVGQRLSGSSNRFGSGDAVVSFVVPEGKTWAGAEVQAKISVPEQRQMVTLPANSAVRVLVKMKTGEVHVPYTVNADLRWVATTEGCVSPWTVGKGVFRTRGTGQPYYKQCPTEGTAYQKVSNGGALTAIGAPLNENLLAQWAMRDLPNLRPPTSLQLGNLLKVQGENVVKAALLNFHQPVKAQVKGAFGFNHALHTEMLVSPGTPPRGLRVIARDASSGVAMMMSPSAHKELASFGEMGLGSARPPITLPPKPPVQPLMVGIDRVAVDDVLSQGEYRPHHSKITGTHSGADKVVLRYENGYSRNAAVYKSGSWAVWLNDADLVAMGKGAERLTVMATAPNKLGTATRNIRVDAVPKR